MEIELLINLKKLSKVLYNQLKREIYEYENFNYNKYNFIKTLTDKEYQIYLIKCEEYEQKNRRLLRNKKINSILKK